MSAKAQTYTGQASPSFTSEKLKSGWLADRIDIFEDRWKGWYFSPAKMLLSQPGGALPALHLMTGYFETYAIYKRGESSEGSSPKFFAEGFLDVFSFNQSWKKLEAGSKMPAGFKANLAKRFYKAVRCGLFHSGMPKQDIVVTDAYNAALTVRANKAGAVGTIIIGPTKMLGQIEAHLDGYVARLRDPQEKTLRAKFNSAWELLNPSVVVAVPALPTLSKPAPPGPPTQPSPRSSAATPPMAPRSPPAAPRRSPPAAAGKKTESPT